MQSLLLPLFIDLVWKSSFQNNFFMLRIPMNICCAKNGIIILIIKWDIPK